MPTPFFFGGHIADPEKFVGRKAELRRIASLLETAHTGQMQSVSIVGERRIGKSSLLFHLKQTYSQWLSKSECYCFAYIDLQSARHDTLPDLLAGILKGLLDCAHPVDRAGKNALGKLRDSLNNGALTLDHFEKALGTLSGELRLYPVICLDEFERLIEKPTEFTNDMYNSWRSLISNSQAAFIIASHKLLPDLALAKQLTSSFFNVTVAQSGPTLS
jgi:Cdc6-like AAA superfamily ATPase